jgi:integrase/recombinase XerD
VLGSRSPGDEVASIEVAVDSDAVRAVRQYVVSQLPRRSQENARDALRRIARMVLGPGAAAEAFPWPSISYELAMRLRRGLFDLTTEGVITPGTANLTLSHLRGIIRTMYAMRIISHEQLAIAHPGMLKGVPGSRVARGRMLQPGEEKRLRTAARDLDGYRGPMLDAAIVLAIGAGLRREDVAGASLERLRPGELSVVGKGNKERQLVVDAQMGDVLGGWLAERARMAPAHGEIFCAPWHPDQPLSAWSFWVLVREAAHQAFGSRQECEDGCRCLEMVTGPHDFRRTFASRLLEQGFDIREVQRLMGHESPQTTTRYDKRDEEELYRKRRAATVLAPFTPEERAA